MFTALHFSFPATAATAPLADAVIEGLTYRRALVEARHGFRHTFTAALAGESREALNREVVTMINDVEDAYRSIGGRPDLDCEFLTRPTRRLIGG